MTLLEAFASPKSTLKRGDMRGDMRGALGDATQHCHNQLSSVLESPHITQIHTHCDSRMSTTDDPIKAPQHCLVSQNKTSHIHKAP